MNDLFVTPEGRGRGTGQALVAEARRVTHSRGARHLEWLTAPGNEAAQRLYDGTGAARSEWIAYELLS